MRCGYCGPRIGGRHEAEIYVLTKSKPEQFAARIRNKMALDAEHPLPTRVSKELTKGHPRNWPSVGDDER